LSEQRSRTPGEKVVGNSEKETLMNHLAIRGSSALTRRGLDRATGNALATLQTDALLERAEDETRLRLSLARMTDDGMATRHALDEGDCIVQDLEARIDRRPFALKALAPLAEDGVHALRRELRDLTGGR
jgi:hypothetical protein